MAKRGPELGRTSTLLARDVRPMYGPTATGLTAKVSFTSKLNVRPDGPYMGRTWAGRASPGTGPGLTPARPAEPIGPDIAGRTSRERAAKAVKLPPIGDCNDSVHTTSATVPATGLPDTETKPTAPQPNYGAVALRPHAAR